LDFGFWNFVPGAWCLKFGAWKVEKLEGYKVLLKERIVSSSEFLRPEREKEFVSVMVVLKFE